MTYDRNAAPKVGAKEWKAVLKAKAERAKARKAWKQAQETCVLFVADSATETAAYVMLAKLRALLLEAGEALGAAEAAYDHAYDAWHAAMSAATRERVEAGKITDRTRIESIAKPSRATPRAAKPWGEMTEDEQAQQKANATVSWLNVAGEIARPTGDN